MTLDLTRSASFASHLIEWLRGKEPILIVTHDHPDPDALAAAYALRHLILVKTGQEATIAFQGGVGRGENQAMVRTLEIETVPLNHLEIDHFAVICLVDAQPGAGNISLPPNCPVDVVIDHHPLREEARSCRWLDVRPDYGATATILFEYLQAEAVGIATKLATILFYAVKSETQSLGRAWTRADREAYLDLLPLCNNRILYEITHPPLSPAYFARVNAALESARIYGDVLVFDLGVLPHPEIVAELADLLLRAEGVRVALGIGVCGDIGVLSLRTRDPEINGGALLQTVTAGFGTAGGHGLTAGGQLRPLPADPAARARLKAELLRRLLAALGRERTEPRPLLTDKC